LVQAFIFDDGNADLDDWVGDNNVTLAADAAAPTWADDNDGLTFDGTDDYATYTPLLTQWQDGFTVAVLMTSPNNVSGEYYWQQYSSSHTEHKIGFATNTGPPYNLIGRAGRRYSSAEINLYTPSSPEVETKRWIFLEYNGSDLAEIYTGETQNVTDTSITENASNNMDTGVLGAQTTSTLFATSTIYRMYFYTKALSSGERTAIVDGWTPTKD
jgi:hypothetical protein